MHETLLNFKQPALFHENNVLLWKVKKPHFQLQALKLQ